MRQSNDSMPFSAHTELASRPGESHPQALLEPYVKLSLHTAPDAQPPTNTADRPLPCPAAPPVTGWLWALAEQRSPFGPVPLQNLQPYYEPLRPCAPHRYSGPCGFSRLDVSLCIETTGSHVPYKSLIQLRAAYMPDATRATSRIAPEFFPKESRAPGSDIILCVSTRHQRFAFARLPGPHLMGCCPTFCRNAHHHRA